MGLTQVSTDGVKNDAITKTKIPANQIEASELADNAVDTNAIANNAVTAGKLASGVQTTINNNADNRVITGSGTANTLNGESGLQWNGTSLSIGNGVIDVQQDSSSLVTPLVVSNGTSGTNANTRLLVKTYANGGGDPYLMFDAGGSNFVMGTRYAGTTNNLLCIGEGSDVQTVNGIFIQADGDVGIGTSSPQSNGLTVEESGGDARLQVRAGSNGASGVVALRADGVNTQLGTWSDHDLKIVRNTNIKASITSNGLCFNSDTAAANALDDYEEGTFTPALTRGYSSISYHYQNGFYTKIGNLVNFTVYIYVYQATGDADYIQISLPFTSVNDTRRETGAYATYDNGTFSSSVDSKSTCCFLIGRNVNYIIPIHRTTGSLVYGNQTRLGTGANNQYFHLSGTMYV